MLSLIVVGEWRTASAEEVAATTAARQRLPRVTYGGFYFRGDGADTAKNFPLLSKVAGIGADGAVIDKQKNQSFHAQLQQVFAQNADKIAHFKLIFGGGAGETSSLALALFFDSEHRLVEEMDADGERHYKAQYLLTGSLTIYDYSKAERSGVYVVGNFPIFFTAVHLFSAAADIDGEKGEEFIRSAVFNLSGATTDGAELTDNLMAGNTRQVRCDLAHQMTEQLFSKLCFMLPGAEAHLQVRGVHIGKQAQEPAHLGERYARSPDSFRQLLAQRISASLATRLAVSVLPPLLDNDGDKEGKKERADQAAQGAAGKTQYAGLGVIRYPSAAYQIRYRLRGVMKQPEPQSDGVTVIFGGYSRMKILTGDTTLWENDYKSAVTNFIPKRMAVRTNDADWFVMLAFVAANDGVAKLDKTDAKLADMLFQCQTQIQKAGHSQGEIQ